MEVFEAIERRRSVRKFRSSPIGPKEVEPILMACNQAPSAGNLQAYEIYLVEDPDRRSALSRAAYDQAFIAQAPAVLVFCMNPDRCRRYGQRGTTLYAIQDASVAAGYAQLAATSLGLASCWVGAFDEDKVRGVLELPEGLRPVVILPLGMADEVPQRAPRRGLEDLVHRM